MIVFIRQDKGVVSVLREKREKISIGGNFFSRREELLEHFIPFIHILVEIFVGATIEKILEIKD